MELKKSMTVIIIENIWMELPLMYNINAFIGRDLPGEKAKSQAFLTFNLEIISFCESSFTEIVLWFFEELASQTAAENPGGLR